MNTSRASPGWRRTGRVADQPSPLRSISSSSVTPSRASVSGADRDPGIPRHRRERVRNFVQQLQLRAAAVVPAHRRRDHQDAPAGRARRRRCSGGRRRAATARVRAPGPSIHIPLASAASAGARAVVRAPSGRSRTAGSVVSAAAAPASTMMRSSTSPSDSVSKSGVMAGWITLTTPAAGSASPHDSQRVRQRQHHVAALQGGRS